MLELKIENFDDKNGKEKYINSWKFIVVEEKKNLALYAGRITEEKIYTHRNLAHENNISITKIVGGGQIFYIPKMLRFEGFSLDFGLIPNSAVEKFAYILKDEMKRNYKIEEAEIEMEYKLRKIGKRDLLKRKKWKKLGYKFDNNKRKIKF